MVRLGALLAVIAGCGGPGWRNADLQIDIEDAGVSDTDQVRICVDGVGVRERPTKAGVVAVPGLPASGALTIRVDRLDDDQRSARAGPVELGDAIHYRLLAWTECTEDCQPCTVDDTAIVERGDDRLLAVRFLD